MSATDPPFAPPGLTITADDASEEGMSDVLLRFAEPALGTAMDERTIGSALTLAVLAWNLALLPEERRARFLEARLPELLTLYDPSHHATVRDIVDRLVQRKAEMFPDLRRFVVGFEVQEQDGARTLHVTTTDPGA